MTRAQQLRALHEAEGEDYIGRLYPEANRAWPAALDVIEAVAACLVFHGPCRDAVRGESRCADTACEYCRMADAYARWEAGR